MQTHAWMAVSAIDGVQDPALRALLTVNLEQVRLGARFPDGGYFPGSTYGEEAHWQRFHDAYLELLRNKAGCGDLTAARGPCADDVAFLFGVIAHGTGDEVWDWLFEPYSPDLGEYYRHADLAAFADDGGQELTMDLVALGVYDVGGPLPLPAYPSVPDLSAAFAAAGMPGVPTKEFDDGHLFIGVAQDVEQGWVPKHLPGVLRNMPWMAQNLVDGPGGVRYAATAIAAQWDHQWDRLLGRAGATTVSAHHPASEERAVPATGWVRDSYLPGSTPGRGGAKTRIALSLTDALPFGRAGGPAESTRLPDGSIVLTVDGSSDPLPLLDGYPKAVPYGAGRGTHTAAIQPAVDLEACTWYRVSTTEALVDADGRPVTPTSWRFRTGTAAGERCADDPAPPPTTGLPTTTTVPTSATTDPAATSTTGGSGAGSGGTTPAAPGARPVRAAATYTG